MFGFVFLFSIFNLTVFFSFWFLKKIKKNLRYLTTDFFFFFKLATLILIKSFDRMTY